ncbi:MAG TPA: IclR family transcriptional regulator [Ktedonobacteraceae bacterium]
MELPDGRNASLSVRRALTIVDYLSEHGTQAGLSLAELADGLDMNKSTLLRLLAALQEFDLIERDLQSECYRLGLRTLHWAEACLASMQIRRIAAPFLVRLMETTRETIHLVTYENGRVVYIDKVDSPNTLRIVSRVGMHMPVHSTAVGKALLAYLPATAFDEVIARGMISRTARTLTSPQALLENLQEIRQRGYAIDDEENELEVRCAAAPIFDHLGYALAAVSISGPIHRVSLERLEELGRQAKQTADQISERLGFRQGEISGDTFTDNEYS